MNGGTGSDRGLIGDDSLACMTNYLSNSVAFKNFMRMPPRRDRCHSLAGRCLYAQRALHALMTRRPFVLHAVHSSEFFNKHSLTTRHVYVQCASSTLYIRCKFAKFSKKWTKVGRTTTYN